MAFGLALGLSLGADTFVRVGPLTISAPTFTGIPPTETVELSATLGSYSPEDGGTIDSVTGVFLMDGEAQTNPFTPQLADIGATIVWRETVTQSGGENPGTYIFNRTVGTVAAFSEWVYGDNFDGSVTILATPTLPPVPTITVDGQQVTAS